MTAISRFLQAGSSLRMSVAGEERKVTGEVGNTSDLLNLELQMVLIWPENFTLVPEEFSDLQLYLMKTLFRRTFLIL